MFGKRVARIAFLVLVISLLITIGNFELGLSADSNQLDEPEQYMLTLFNDYRSSQGCRPVVFDPTKQAGVEQWAIDSSYPSEHRSPAPFGEILTYVTDYSPYGNGAADEALDWWVGSGLHEAKISDCNFTGVAIAHAYRNDWAYNPAWYWVAEFTYFQPTYCGDLEPGQGSAHSDKFWTVYTQIAEDDTVRDVSA
ncbi:hypothetical protein KJ596_01845 [Patescibacteria group bacterium]|nr:hypothetical protein [Patescibacteria group bacterium]MBU1868208.1 hypothetical protein [Patescibacteria group bacterium]